MSGIEILGSGGGGTTGGATGGTTGTTGGATGGTTGSTTGGTTGGTTGSSTPGALHTQNNHIYDANGKVWMGRGVNIDDLFLCGGNSSVDSSKLIGVIDDAMKWAPHMNFIRVSLYMNSYASFPETWSATSVYAQQMTKAIEHIGTAYPGVYVLVSLRTDPSMVCYSNLGSSPSATTCAPGNCESDCTPTTNTNKTFKALVDSFANSPFVIFGAANEPYAGTTVVRTAMSQAVSAIRAEEDLLMVPHHLVSVQSTYAGNPGSVFQPAIASDNVVYEFHYYPSIAAATTSDLSYSNTLPALIGEYGLFNASGDGSETAFFNYVESQSIPNVAWDYSPYSDCYPDLINFSESAAWGPTVQAYIAAHPTD